AATPRRAPPRPHNPAFRSARGPAWTGAPATPQSRSPISPRPCGHSPTTAQPHNRTATRSPRSPTTAQLLNPISFTIRLPNWRVGRAVRGDSATHRGHTSDVEALPPRFGGASTKGLADRQHRYDQDVIMANTRTSSPKLAVAATGAVALAA